MDLVELRLSHSNEKTLNKKYDWNGKNVFIKHICINLLPFFPIWHYLGQGSLIPLKTLKGNNLF